MTAEDLCASSPRDDMTDVTTKAEPSRRTTALVCARVKVAVTAKAAPGHDSLLDRLRDLRAAVVARSGDCRASARDRERRGGLQGWA